jgi:predicted metal-dependent HD superfamily phosphohydrolase
LLIIQETQEETAMDAWNALEAMAPLHLTDERYRALVTAYGQPQRAYHSFAHVLEVAQHWRDIQERLCWRQPRETFLAVLYHDAIYVAGKTDNERKSAQLAHSQLDGVNGVNLDEVERLIILTASHGKLTLADVDQETALFLDCDMAIVGSPPERFSQYEKDIRAEYASTPHLLFQIGRRRFLQRLLGLPRIFLSEDFHRRLDHQARINLAVALKNIG